MIESDIGSDLAILDADYHVHIEKLFFVRPATSPPAIRFTEQGDYFGGTLTNPYFLVTGICGFLAAPGKED